MSDQRKTIELNESYAVLSLPTGTVEIELTAHVYHDGKIITVEREYSMEDVREAFRSAEEDYFAPDDIWSLRSGYEVSGKECQR